MTDLPPQNPLETLLKSAMDGQTSIGGFMKAFVASEVIVPNGSLVTPDGSGFDPIVFDDKGTRYVAVFTDMARLGNHTQLAPYLAQLKLIHVLGYLHDRHPGHGVVVNPGASLGMELKPDGIGTILADFADPFRP
ncbi:SseB family protein [Stenotrophomonas sp.]|uniref:SseB family protein n=1 Tax=Stenotrophomonas sp. TaxID=69392 RepID=UPI0028ABB60A|nr:SseB family protein [Stenotrophomonas sp.]